MIRKTFGMGFAFCIANTALLPFSEAQAQTKAVVPDESLFGDNTVKLNEDEDLQLSVRLTVEASLLDDIDLDSLTDDSQARIQPEARVDVLYTPDDDIEILASVEAGFDLDRRTGQWNSIERLEVREMYILFDDFIAKDFQLQVGRQDVEDGREWLYDSRLDGIRVAYDHRQWRIEAMWGREELVRSNLLKNEPVRRKVDNFLFHAEYEATPDWDISAYAIKQKDLRASNISPLTIGVQSEGRMGQIGHWLELAQQSGTSGTRKLRARAVDAGVIWHLPLPAKPALFAGYAHATGGGNATKDKGFRQTGLQDNEDRITGLGNVRYYGEALDPDLSNIEIWTLGMGIRPTAFSSLELIAHRYRQAVRDDDDVRGSPISAELSGDDRDIGTEIDVAFSTRLAKPVALEAKVGWFMPGKGFDTFRKDAILAKVRLVIRF
jgi:alginate production protein